jgi:hypothetical protein
MNRTARLAVTALVPILLSAAPVISEPTPARAETAPRAAQLAAELDGKPIELGEVADWYCDDFSFPLIRCFTDYERLEARQTSLESLTTIDYVTIYDYASFAGTYMHVSEDYTVLALLGWNDRISSFKARNGEAGHFYVDWFYGGTGYYFCCNSQVPSLGRFDNAFSSVHRD